jgi:hypothetical protein
MSGGTTFTGAGVDVFRWLSVRAQLRLEKVGMKSRGGPLRPRLAGPLGLKPRDSHDKYIEAVDAKIAEAEGRLQPGDVQAF